MREWGYEVRTAHSENYQDIWASRGKNLAFIEVLNFAKKSWIPTKRAGKIVENLTRISENRFLVCSFPYNVAKYRKRMEENEIQIIYVGFQTIPEELFDRNYDEAKVKRTGAKRNGEEVIEALRIKLEPLRTLPDVGEHSIGDLIKRLRKKKLT